MDRIETLAYYARNSKKLCDIGCDHAYTLVEAMRTYNVEAGIAADIALGPLENAKKTLKRFHLENRVQVIQSDGFSAISEDSFDTAILSGMGGNLITNILTNGIAKLKNKRLILEANSEVFRVRAFLVEHGYQITEETALYDQDKYYEILVAEEGISSYDAYDINYGPILRRALPDAFVKHYTKKCAILAKALEKQQDGPRKDSKLVEYREMKYILEKKNMEKYYINQTSNYYRTYFLDDAPRPTIFLCPGGAYKYTSPRESEPVVEAFLSYGFHVVLINYRETVVDAYPLPGTYVKMTLDALKEDRRITKKIGLGFSAGGHCILELCLHSKDYQLENKLDLLMLGYPVITSDAAYAHLGSFMNLLKESFEKEELRSYLSLETQVTKENAIDLFLWGTMTDESVSVMNSLKLIEAYHKVGASVEYHLFPMGAHGLSVADESSSEGNKEKEIPYIARWVSFAVAWIKNKLNMN